jgi:hypothetical protein
VELGLAGWKVMAELPGPVNFAAHACFVRPSDVAEAVPHGPDLPLRGAGVRRRGVHHVALCRIGADRQEDFVTWAEAELLPALRGRFG